jgi:hypothetical protein
VTTAEGADSSCAASCVRSAGIVASRSDDRWPLGLEFVGLITGASVAIHGLARLVPRPSHMESAMQLRYLFASASALTLSACIGVSTSASLIDPSLHLARTCPAAVKLYTVPDRVQQPYREVALLNSSGQTSYSSEADMIKSMRESAAKVGANGIILNGIDEPSAMAKLAGQAAQIAADAAGQIAQISAERKGRAVAIYVPADSTQTIVACTKAKR